MSGGGITKEDLVDADVVDATELRSAAAAGDAYKTGVTVVSTTAGTKQVVVSGFNLLTERDTPLQVADKVVITGSAAAGTYTINSVINATTFDVVEAIVTSAGGTVAFRHPSGATKVGVSVTRVTQANPATTTLQVTLEDLDVALLLEQEPSRPDNNYDHTITSGKVTQERWKRGDTTLIRSIDYTYSGSKVATEVRKVFATDGTTILGQDTRTYAYPGSAVTIALVRNV